MKQLLLSAALMAVPVVAFTMFQVYESHAMAGSPAAAANLGDLSAFRSIISDVQGIAATGDLAGAKARIKDFEISWDQSAVSLSAMDSEHWGLIDGAADSARN